MLLIYLSLKQIKNKLLFLDEIWKCFFQRPKISALYSFLPWETEAPRTLDALFSYSLFRPIFGVLTDSTGSHTLSGSTQIMLSNGRSGETDETDQVSATCAEQEDTGDIWSRVCSPSSHTVSSHRSCQL